jgi:hypothetical protein
MSKRACAFMFTRLSDSLSVCQEMKRGAGDNSNAGAGWCSDIVVG